MVTFNAMGRMGNFLFQCATAFSFAKKYGLEFTVPHHTSHEFWSPLYLKHLQNPNYNNSLPTVRIDESHFHYSPIEFDESHRDKNILLYGYFQSEKYFMEHRDEILLAFNYPYDMKKDTVSVHVRRTDYITYKDKHPEVTKEWYELAMSKFSDKNFIFYSDDISWCKENFSNRTDCSFSDGTIEEDLVSMSCCEHNICSASTFAWWSMWLNQNENKKVIFPQKWFTDGWDGADTKDILPEWVIKL